MHEELGLDAFRKKKHFLFAGAEHGSARDTASRTLVRVLGVGDEAVTLAGTCEKIFSISKKMFPRMYFYFS